MDPIREIGKTEKFILSFTKYISFLFIALFIGLTVFSLLKIFIMRADIMTGTRIVVEYDTLRQMDEQNTKDIETGLQQLSERKSIERKYEDAVKEIIANANLRPVEKSYDFIMQSVSKYPEQNRDDYINGMKKLLRTAINEKENKDNLGPLLDKYNRIFYARYQNIEQENSNKLANEKYYLGFAAICFVSLLLFVVILVLLRIEGNTRNTTYVIPVKATQPPLAGMERQQHL